MLHVIFPKPSFLLSILSDFQVYRLENLIKAKAVKTYQNNLSIKYSKAIII